VPNISMTSASVPAGIEVCKVWMNRSYSKVSYLTSMVLVSYPQSLHFLRLMKSPSLLYREDITFKLNVSTSNYISGVADY